LINPGTWPNQLPLSRNNKDSIEKMRATSQEVALFYAMKKKIF